MSHSILPPSGAAAWAKCALWVRMVQAYPQGDTPESLEGNAAHWCFAEMLAGRDVCEGTSAPNGVIVTSEMIDGADMFVDVVNTRLAGMSFNVEKPVSMTSVHPSCWGTPDVDGYRDGIIEIVDYKFGHRFVDEYENLQCIVYAIGVLEREALKRGVSVGALDQATLVNITIVQPRCFYRGSPIRTWSVAASDLRPIVNMLAGAAARAMLPNPKGTTNPECRDCPGRHACPVLQQAAYADAEYSYVSAPLELPPAAASLELRMLERAAERLNARIDGLQTAVAAYARQGIATPFHALEQTKGRKVWSVPIDQVVALGALMGKQLAKPAVVTPTQAKALGVDEAVISAYSKESNEALRLVPENPAKARRVFGIVNS